MEALKEARQEILDEIRSCLDKRHRVRLDWYRDLRTAISEKLRREVFDDVARYIYATHVQSYRYGIPLASNEHYERCIKELFPINMGAPDVLEAIASVKFSSDY